MGRSLQTLKYLSKSFTALIGIGFLTILGNVVLTDLVFYLNHRYTSVPLTAPFEIATGMYALLIGLVLFPVNFKVALANGVSRRSFLLANLSAIGMAAAAFSIFNLGVVLVHGLFWPINMPSGLFYHTGWVGLLVLQFALYGLLMVVGWFIALAYYRGSDPVQLAITLTPFVLFGLLLAANARTGGAIFGAIQRYLVMSLGLETGSPDPYRAAFSLLAYSAVLLGLVYLLIRRAPLKD